MPSKEHLLNQVNQIAERRRNEPGEMHPFRKVHMHCKICNKPIMVYQHNLKSTGNCCHQCKFKDPYYVKKYEEGFQKRSENKDWLKKQTEINQINGNKLYVRKKISCAKQGCHEEDWKGFSKNDYCFKWNPRRRRAVRKFFGDLCICCGKHASENIIKWKQGNGYTVPLLPVHHVDHNKDQGCNGIPFNLVPLCSSCHGNCQGKKIEDYKNYINKILESGFEWGIWSREEYEREVMYPE